MWPFTKPHPDKPPSQPRAESETEKPKAAEVKDDQHLPAMSRAEVEDMKVTDTMLNTTARLFCG